jgi:hypothetical protein
MMDKLEDTMICIMAKGSLRKYKRELDMLASYRYFENLKNYAKEIINDRL